MKSAIENLICLLFKRACFPVIALLMVTAIPVQNSDAQVVPYRVKGTGFGSLVDLSSFGEATGAHLGRVTFVGNDQGVTTLYTRDGSSVQTKRLVITYFNTTQPDSNGLVVTTLVEEVQFLGGTRRFENAGPTDETMMTFVESEPYDPDGNITAIPFSFETIGEFDLGKRR